jgi:hypothetical protein
LKLGKTGEALEAATAARNCVEELGFLGHKPSEPIFLSNTYFTSVVQQPFGYSVTGQLQEPKDLIRPATAKVVLTIL